MDAASILAAPIAVIGNADGPVLPCAPGTTCFTFNGCQASRPHVMHIKLAMSAGIDGFPRIGAKGDLPPGVADDVEALLNGGMAERCEGLGCWPSTGYAAIHALWRVAKAVTVQRVSLDPSLLRSTALSMRQPLPQAFHNWLGERRTTYARWLDDPRPGWRWRLVNDDGQMAAVDASHSARIVHPIELVDAFKTAAKSGSLARVESMTSATVHPSRTLLEPSAQMRALEQNFHLDRNRTDTTNWWLYDAKASVHVELIARQLRDAQRTAFIKAAAEKSRQVIPE